MNPNDEETIDVMTATATEDEVRAALAPPAVEDKKPAKAVADKPAEEAKADDLEPDDVEGDEEVAVVPPAKSTEDTVRLAKERKVADRKQRLVADNTMYADTVRRMGGNVPVFIKRKYANPQAEIDHLSRYRHDLLTETNRVMREGGTTVKPTAEKPQPQAEKPAEKTQEPKKFAFKTWEQYQEENPDADFTDYTDARSDARDVFKEEQRQASLKADGETRAKTEFETRVKNESAAQMAHVEAFTERYPDFQEKTAAVKVDDRSPFYPLVANLLRQAGADCPKVMYYLADRPEDVTRLMNAASVVAAIETFGELKYAARLAYPDTDTTSDAEIDDEAPVPLPKKTAARASTNASTPLSGVRGRTTTTQSLQDLADEDDDADKYIARRTRELAGG